MFKTEATGPGIINNEHNAENSPDFMGIYHGLLPCTVCEEIEVTMELGSGNSYVKKTIF